MRPDASVTLAVITGAHGVTGEVRLKLFTDDLSGYRSFNGGSLTMKSLRNGIARFAEVPDRNAAETWRGRYLLVPADEVPPPSDEEVYVHELPGMRVELADGQLVGSVEETYELPQGLAIDVRRAPPREQETVLVPFNERTIASVDREARVIVVTPAEGLLE